MKQPWKKMMGVGPGGVRCSCCFPAPGTQARKVMQRNLRKRLKAEVAQALRADEV